MFQQGLLGIQIGEHAAMVACVRYDFYWMAFITVSGEPATRHQELARIASQRLRCELVTEARLVDIIASEFGAAEGISDKAWPHLALSILAKLGTEHHLVVSSHGRRVVIPQPAWNSASTCDGI
jgi:hypothetical protein